MRKQVLVASALATLVVLAACSSMRVATTKAGHPSLTEQEMLVPCFECHQQVTPQIYTEWYDSTHGISQVKCYQCHGTYENMRVTPDMAQSCGACHADKLGDHTGNQTCWECHGVHSFLSE